MIYLYVVALLHTFFSNYLSIVAPSFLHKDTLKIYKKWNKCLHLHLKFSETIQKINKIIPSVIHHVFHVPVVHTYVRVPCKIYVTNFSFQNRWSKNEATQDVDNITIPREFENIIIYQVFFQNIEWWILSITVNISELLHEYFVKDHLLLWQINFSMIKFFPSN